MRGDRAAQGATAAKACEREEESEHAAPGRPRRADGSED